MLIRLRSRSLGDPQLTARRPTKLPQSRLSGHLATDHMRARRTQVIRAVRMGPAPLAETINHHVNPVKLYILLKIKDRNRIHVSESGEGRSSGGKRNYVEGGWASTLETPGTHFLHFPLFSDPLLAQAPSQTLCQTGWWRNHCFIVMPVVMDTPRCCSRAKAEESEGQGTR